MAMRSHDLHWTIHASPVGPLTLIGDELVLTGLHFEGYGHGLGAARRDPEAPPLAAAAAQLDEYFAGERRDFDLELDLRGTEFQRAVWDELLRIPYGETMSYGELARRLGRPERVRAVGAANGRNPVAIVAPCHRVIGADGSLTGYGGGLDRKRALLAVEGSAPLALL
jgi:methylated-DNA-[protein]-cysteine S-methyltransferase